MEAKQYNNIHIQKKIYFSNFFLLKFFVIQFIINLIITEDCPRENPFLKEGSCIYYCEEEEFNNKTCEFNNTLAKTQWLNNIIFLGQENFTYIAFANYSNEEFISHIEAFQHRNRRFGAEKPAAKKE